MTRRLLLKVITGALPMGCGVLPSLLAAETPRQPSRAWVVLEVDRKHLPPGVTIDVATVATVREILAKRLPALGIAGEVRPRGADQFTIEVSRVQPAPGLPPTLAGRAERLCRVTKLEFIWLKDIRSNENPAGRYTMETVSAPNARSHVLRTWDASGKPGQTRVQETTGYRFTDRTGKQVSQSQVLSQSDVIVGSRDLQPNTQAKLDPLTRVPIVEFALTDAGTRRFAEFTAAHTGAHMAIVLDHQILAAPVIRDAITTGRGQIEGGFQTLGEAEILSQFLNAGPLPMPLRVASETPSGH